MRDMFARTLGATPLQQVVTAPRFLSTSLDALIMRAESCVTQVQKDCCVIEGVLGVRCLGVPTGITSDQVGDLPTELAFPSCAAQMAAY